MSLLDGLFTNRNKKKLAKQMVKEASRPATRADIDKLRIELKETPEEKEELQIYEKWISLTKAQQREKWNILTIKDKNKLGRIVSEHKVGNNGRASY